MPWPGVIRTRSDKYDGLTVTPLLFPHPDQVAGSHAWNQHFTQGFFGLERLAPDWRTGTQLMPNDAMAVHIAGTMQRTLPLVDIPEAGESEEAGENDDAPAEVDDGVGRISEQPINVMVIADIDFAHDQFFAFYRNVGRQFSEEFAILSQLENTQFAANIVDNLTGQTDFASLRTKQPQSRPLTMIKDALQVSQLEFDAIIQQKKGEADATVAELEQAFQDKLVAIDQREDLDANARNQLKAQEQQVGRRMLDQQIEQITIEVEREERRIQAQRNSKIDDVKQTIVMFAWVIPTVILLTLAIAVLSLRQQRERIEIPASRTRGQS